ncbi:Asparagine synthetase domain-containing protein, partial [Fulvia fulva]
PVQAAGDRQRSKLPSTSKSGPSSARRVLLHLAPHHKHQHFTSWAGRKLVMCGIFCSISRHKHIQPPASIQTLLQARGPDASDTLLLECCCSEPGDETTYVTCHSTVLSLRGSVTTQQPYQGGDKTRTLCWNGEAWAIRGHRPDGNDTASVYDLLNDAVSQDLPRMDCRGESLAAAQNVSQAFSQVAGPYAFVFLDQSASKVWLGRDFLGRRSLLYRITNDGAILLSSVTDGSAAASWTEVEADGVYCIDLSQRAYSRDTNASDLQRWGDFFVTKVPSAYNDIERQADSVLPRLSLCRDVSSPTAPLGVHSVAVTRLERLLRESLIPRVLDIPEPPGCSSLRPRSKLAILFSGGLDCTVLARLSHESLPSSEPIDLLNVAFQNPRVHKDKGDAAYELCPDRITGRASHAELQEVCSGRKWRFVAIDIPYAETQEHRQHVIDLMHPHNTEMDLSIAFALYFAARGSGKLDGDGSAEALTYTTSARVLLSGLGADELFAGYTRHATAYNRHGLDGLLDELDLDIGRLGRRNLGRDDRVISHWSREVRFPFLDEKLVGWAVTAPVTDKCDFGAKLDLGNDEAADDSCSSIEPGKKVLRCLAWKLGMIKVAKKKKRAIQFGARTAKMETGRSKGTTLLS